jgi:hypothetical protein
MRPPRSQNSFTRLRGYARRDRAADREVCELCSQPIPARHRHLLDTATRQIACACDACALRFQDVVEGAFKLIPRDARTLPGFQMSDALWSGLALPINLAFFLHSTPGNKVVAMYPSPAGATESLLPLDAWEALVAANPVLRTLTPDVEALLINRVGEAHHYFLAPIDACYRLVGLIRLHWKGLSGGEEAWHEIGQFFEQLERQARPANEAHHA